MDSGQKKKVDSRAYTAALIGGVVVYFITEMIFRHNPDFLPLLTQFYYTSRSGLPINLCALIMALFAAGLSGYLYEKITGTSADNWEGPPGQ